MNKANWLPGPWHDEPDERHWEAHGFACHVTRVPPIGHLCGYVTVPPGHPWHGKGYDDIGAEAHGGLTYSRTDGDGWRVGFDCAHAGDCCPGTDAWLGRKRGHEVYRDFAFVVAELSSVIHF